MCDNVNSNPFAALFSTINDAVSFSSQNQAVAADAGGSSDSSQEAKCSNLVKSPAAAQRDYRLDELIADVFGITLHWENEKKPNRQLVFIDTDSVEHAIFERLLLPDPESKLISKESTKGQDLDSHVVQIEIVPYLFESYCRLQRYRISDGSYDTVENIRRIIVRNVSTALQEPGLFSEQEVCIVK